MMRETPGSESELVRGLREGDEDAFRTIYSRLQAQVYRFALHMAGSRSLADDTVQEAFLSLIHGSHRFDSQKGSLAAFVLGIARNCLLRRLKAERVYVPVPDDHREGGQSERASNSDPLAQLDRSEKVRQVRNAVLTLPLRYREVIVLCELEEKSYEETAQLLGCSLGTVRSRLHRARALLLSKLKALEPRPELSKARSKRCPA
jgi:RNA polymerase sigma-70 factor (ECF subfamily)